MAGGPSAGSARAARELPRCALEVDEARIVQEAEIPLAEDHFAELDAFRAPHAVQRRRQDMATSHPFQQIHSVSQES